MKYFLMIITFFISSLCIFSMETYYFPVSHRIVTTTDSTGRMQDATMIPVVMQELNKAFAPANIQFFMSCVTSRSPI